MPCYFPLHAWRSIEGRSKNGAWPITFDRLKGYGDMPVQIPCGQCIGCRLEYARRWAVRCVFESLMYDQNCFVTLTYDDEHLPENANLRPEDFTKFMKRFRKLFNNDHIRYFQCGEYGSQTFRPHHHAIIFNFDFPDKQPFSVANGNVTYTSQILSKLWPFGHSLIGTVSFESAGYCARYNLKKLGADKDYLKAIEGRHRPYITMSRRPGIGQGFYNKYFDDLYGQEFTVCNGVKMQPPPYFDKLLKIDNPQLYETIKRNRMLRAKELGLDDLDPSLQIAKAVTKERKIESLKRTI